MREKRAAIYVRVSTSEQDTGLQETELRQYVESRGWDQAPIGISASALDSFLYLLSQWQWMLG